MQQNAEVKVARPKIPPQRADKKRDQDVQKVIRELEEEMRRLVDILVSQTNRH